MERSLPNYGNVLLAAAKNDFPMMTHSNISIFYPSKPNIPGKYISTVIS